MSTFRRLPHPFYRSGGHRFGSVGFPATFITGYQLSILQFSRCKAPEWQYSHRTSPHFLPLPSPPPQTHHHRTTTDLRGFGEGVCEWCLIEVEEVPSIVARGCGTDGWWGVEKIKETFGSYRI